MLCEAPVMTAIFLSLLMLVSFIHPGHGNSGAYGLRLDISIRMQQPAKMTFSYPLALSATADADAETVAVDARALLVD